MFFAHFIILFRKKKNQQQKDDDTIKISKFITERTNENLASHIFHYNIEIRRSLRTYTNNRYYFYDPTVKRIFIIKPNRYV